MFNYLKEYFCLKRKFELFISIFVIYIGIIYYQVTYDIQLLFLFTLFFTLFMISSGGIASLIDVYLETKKGTRLDKLRISEGIEVYIPYIINVVILVLSLIVLFFIKDRINVYILIFVFVMYFAEVLYNSSFNEDTKSILANMIRIFTNTILIAICFVDIVGSNIFSVSTTTLTIHFQPVEVIIILFLPLVVLFSNIMLAPILSASEFEAVKKHVYNIIFWITLIGVLFIAIAILLEILPTLFLSMFVLLPLFKYFKAKYDLIKYTYLTSIVYTISFLGLMIIATIF